MTTQRPWRNERPEAPFDEDLRPRQLRDELIDFSIVWRDRYRILAAALATAAVAAGILVQVAPTYEATSQVMLVARESRVIDIANVTPDTTANEAVVQSEVTVLRAAPLLQSVAEELDLANDPEFNPSLQELGRLSYVLASVRSFIAGLLSGPPPEETGAIDEVKIAADELSRHLRVRPLGISYIIEVSASSQSPTRAAEIANTVVKRYMDNQLESKFKASERATSWLESRVQKLRAELIADERKVEDFKATAAMEGYSTPEVLDKLRTELSVELIRARGELATRKSRYQEFKRLLADKNYLAASNLSDSGLVAEYRRRHANVSSEIEDFKIRFGDEYSGTKRLIKMRDDIERSLRDEVEKIGTGFQSSVEIAEARLKALASDLKDAESAFAEQSVMAVELREMQREAQASRVVFEQFLVRLKEMRERGGFQNADARIVSLAEVPTSPAAPQKALLVLVAAFGGGMTALLGSLIAHARRYTLISEEDVRRCCGLPVIGNLPKVSDATSALEVLEWMCDRPFSALAEAIRWLRVRLGSGMERSPQIIVVTSALPGEGKSTLALLLAQNSASNGANTLLIDADLRRKLISKAFALTSAGLHLIEERGFTVFSLDSLSGGDHRLLSSADFLEVLSSARERYETIIIDAPPVLSVSDVAVLCHNADATIMACRWDLTPQGALEQAVRQLRALGVNVTGLVLTFVDLKRQAKATFTGAGYALHQSMTYYSDEVLQGENGANSGAFSLSEGLLVSVNRNYS